MHPSNGGFRSCDPQTIFVLFSIYVLKYCFEFNVRLFVFLVR